VAGMRRVLSSVVPGITVLEGTAESIPMPDASVNAVTVAQAFHWFRPQEALAEVHRVLRPGGTLVLVWNVRDLHQPLQSAMEQIMARYRGISPSQASGEWKKAFTANFLFGSLADRSFPMEQVLNTPQLVARALSISFIACLPRPEQDRVAAEVESLVPAGTRSVMLRYVTEVYWCRRLG
jgi:SAM-dependent methyltransferase